jgi:hypothetical protein
MLAFILLGYPLGEAFLEAEKMMEELLKASYRLTSDGYFYTALTHIAGKKGMRWNVLQSLNEAASRLRELNMVELIPKFR